ncbi:hypothetical protein H2279_06335, partial [Campylobacter sp. B0100352/1]|uniref:hypothetical protein n=1 Tax=Campylobacter sp. B0100352/1 TaxID=2735783 RepID=UPI001E0388CD|nr:hypothetical protein [Campylobacter sp. B0100352/1]
MKNIVLIGASNSLIFNGLRAGLNQKNINLKNLSLGGANILHICYEIHRKTNCDIIKKADLIIIESNIIDVVQNVEFSNLYYENQILKNIFLTYQELSKLNKKILVLLLPILENENSLIMVEKINNGHRYCCNKFHFNCIDVQQLYLSKDIMKFYMNNMPETRHQMFSIMYQLGKNIANFDFDNFVSPLENKFEYHYDIQILYPYEFCNYDSKNRKLKVSDLLHKEICYRIQKDDKLIFPKYLVGYSIISVHSWTHGDLSLKGKPWEYYLNTTSSLILENKNFKYIFGTSHHYNAFMNFYENNKIDNHTYLYLHEEGKIDYYDIVSVMLIKNYDSIVVDNNLKDIVVKKTLDFTYLYPDAIFIKDILEEYICRMDPIKQA